MSRDVCCHLLPFYPPLNWNPLGKLVQNTQNKCVSLSRELRPKETKDVAPFIASNKADKPTNYVAIQKCPEWIPRLEKPLFTGRCNKSLTWRPQRDGHNRPRRNGQTWINKIRFSPCAEQSCLKNVGFRHHPGTTGKTVWQKPSEPTNRRQKITISRLQPLDPLRLWRDAIPVRLWISRSLWTHALLPWHHLWQHQDWPKSLGGILPVCWKFKNAGNAQKKYEKRLFLFLYLYLERVVIALPSDFTFQTV